MPDIIHDVIVSNERLEKSVMQLGEWQSYKATVTDENGNQLFQTFCVRLMVRLIRVGILEPEDKPSTPVAEVCFAPDVYDPDTKEVSIAFTIDETTLMNLGCYSEFLAQKEAELEVYLEWDYQELS